MNRLLPLKNKGLVMFLQGFIAMTFCLALYWNVSLFLQKRAIEKGCQELEGVSQRLERVEKQIAKFERVRSLVLPEGSDTRARYQWESVSLHFEPLEFSKLLRRLSLLNKEIQQKYHREGIFVLTDFETVRDHSKGKGEKQGPSPEVQADGRPGFAIRGKLLCLYPQTQIH